MNIQEALNFEQNLYQLINTCGLPVDTAFYIFKSVYLDFQNTVYEYAKKDTNSGYSVEEQVIGVNEDFPETIEISE